MALLRRFFHHNSTHTILDLSQPWLIIKRMDHQALAPSVPSGEASVTLDTAVLLIFVVAEEVRETSE